MDLNKKHLQDSRFLFSFHVSGGLSISKKKEKEKKVKKIVVNFYWKSKFVAKIRRKKEIEIERKESPRERGEFKKEEYG